MSLVMKYMHVKITGNVTRSAWESSHPGLCYRSTQTTTILLWWWLLINYSLLQVIRSIHIVMDIENVLLNIEIWWYCKCKQKYISQIIFRYANILYKQKNGGFRRKIVSLNNLEIHNSFLSHIKEAAHSFVLSHILWSKKYFSLYI